MKRHGKFRFQGKKRGGSLSKCCFVFVLSLVVIWLIVALSLSACSKEDAVESLQSSNQKTLSSIGPPSSSSGSPEKTSSRIGFTPRSAPDESVNKRSSPPPLPRPPLLSPPVPVGNKSGKKEGNLRPSFLVNGPDQKQMPLKFSSSWLRASANCEGGIITMTYATSGGKDDRFCRSVESALQHEVPLRILGWGKDWRGLTQKLEGSLDALKNLPDKCTVLFTDAYDVLYADDLEAIKRKFDDMGEPVLFAGECGCWPQITRDKGNGHVCLHDYPKSPTPYKYLNSGQWIAKKTAALEIFSALMEEAHIYAEKYNVHESKINDQEMVSDMYMDGR